MMTPAEFKAAREAKLKAKAWDDDRIRREIAECALADSWTVHVPIPAASRERAKTIAIAGGWCVSLRTSDGGGLDTWIMDLETGGPAASVNLETYRGAAAIILPTAAEHHTRVAGLVPLTRKEVVALIDDAIATALSDGGDPRVTVRQHSAQLVIDVAVSEGCSVCVNGHHPRRGWT